MYANKRQKVPTTRTLSEPDRKKTQRLRIEDNRAGHLSRLPLQLVPVKYIRGIKAGTDDEINAETFNIIKERIEYEHERLNQEKKVPKKPDPSVYNPSPDHLSDYLGGAILSVSRYNVGQKKYFAPVGYIIEIEPTEENVLGNYKGDGNVSNPNMNVIQIWIDELRTRVDKMQELVKLFDNLPTDISSAQPADEKVKQILRAYFQSSSKTKDPLGPGNPENLSVAEQNIRNAGDQVFTAPSNNRKITYTESEIHLKGSDAISGAYYNPNHNEKYSSELKKQALHINTVLKKTNLFKINESGVLVEDTSNVADAPPSIPEEAPPSVD